MISWVKELAPNVFGMRVGGTITKADYDEVLPRLEQLIEREGKVRVLVVLDDIEGFRPAALWEELKFDVRHFRDFERLALVGDSKWEENLVRVSAPLMKGEARFFDKAHEDDAWTWIAA